MLAVPDAVPVQQTEAVAGLEHRAVGHVADADLGPGKIEQDRDLFADSLGSGANGAQSGLQLVGTRVRSIQPNDIDPRRDESLHHLGRVRRGSQGGHDLRATHLLTPLASLLGR